MTRMTARPATALAASLQRRCRGGASRRVVAPPSPTPCTADGESSGRSGTSGGAPGDGGGKGTATEVAATAIARAPLRGGRVACVPVSHGKVRIAASRGAGKDSRRAARGAPISARVSTRGAPGALLGSAPTWAASAADSWWGRVTSAGAPAPAGPTSTSVAAGGACVTIPRGGPSAGRGRP